MPRKMIIDTDPGVDDALAIFMAFNSPEVRETYRRNCCVLCLGGLQKLACVMEPPDTLCTTAIQL